MSSPPHYSSILDPEIHHFTNAADHFSLKLKQQSHFIARQRQILSATVMKLATSDS